MVELTESAKALIEAKNLVHFVTLMPDGSPKVTPLWVDHDGTHVSSTPLRAVRSRATLLATPASPCRSQTAVNPYTYVQIRGKVVEVTTDGAWDHICKMNNKYLGNLNYPKREGETRLLVRIAPEHISGRDAPARRE